MQKLCCVCTRQHPLPVWSHKFVISSTTHFFINSRPFLVGIVSLTFKALTTMKLLFLMWLLLQPSSTHLKEKSLAYSMNMPILGRDHPFIHQANLNGLRPMLMKNLSKLVVPNLSLLWMDTLSLSSSRMVWPMPPHLTWKTHSSGHGHISTCLLHIS